jgi:EpsI family protein
MESGSTVPALSRRQLVLGAILGAAGASAQAFVPRQTIDYLGKSKLESLVPDRVGNWSYHSKSGLVVPPSDQLSQSLYAQLITRVYTAPNELPIMLLIAQSPAQDGVLQVHRPEICYPASGYALSGSAVRRVPILGRSELATTKFTATGEGRVEQLLYWTRVGDELPTTWWEQRLAVAEANLRGQIPDGVLVRVSTISPDTIAFPTLERFVQELISASPPLGRKVLLGPAI